MHTFQKAILQLRLAWNSETILRFSLDLLAWGFCEPLGTQGTWRDAGPSDQCCAISMTRVKIPGIAAWRLHNRIPPHTHTHTYIHTYTHTPTHIRTHMHTHTHTHTYTHIHTHTHIHTLVWHYWQELTGLINGAHTHTHRYTYTHTLAYSARKCTKASIAVEVRKRTLYRKLILRKWRLKFSNNFDVIVEVVLDCLVYACEAFNGNSTYLLRQSYRA